MAGVEWQKPSAFATSLFVARHMRLRLDLRINVTHFRRTLDARVRGLHDGPVRLPTARQRRSAPLGASAVCCCHARIFHASTTSLFCWPRPRTSRAVAGASLSFQSLCGHRPYRATAS